MGYETRLKLFKQLEEFRGKPLITYVTSLRPNVFGMMAPDALSSIISQVQAVPKTDTEVDFLIVSNGGDGMMALQTVNILRERFKKFSVLVPYAAFSAATLLSLGADEIIMHPFSNLGPVDPQFSETMPTKSGQQETLHYSTEDIRHYFDFIRSDVGISDQEHLISAFNSLVSKVNPLRIGISKKFQQLTFSLSVKLLETHMTGNKEKVESIVKTLYSAFFHHGYPVSREEATKIGLNIIKPEPIIESLMWDIWIDYRNEMKCDSEFDMLSELLANDEAKKFISTNSIVNLPMNTPPDVASRIIAEIVRENATISHPDPIEIQILSASIESSRLSYSLTDKYIIYYFRNADMSLNINPIQCPRLWECVDISRNSL